MDFCLISVPFGHYDEPEILRYENTSACPIGADVRHKQWGGVTPKAGGRELDKVEHNAMPEYSKEDRGCALRMAS